MTAVLALTACGRAADNRLPPPRDGRSGLQLSGTLDGRQVAVNDALPNLRAADCDVNEGPDTDVCIVAEELNGQLFIVVFENPAALAAGADLSVADPGCRPDTCDDITDVAVVELQQGFADRVRAVGGSVVLTVVEPGVRYAGTLGLRFPGGRLDGSFDVVPRPDLD